MPYNIPEVDRIALLDTVRHVTFGIFADCRAFNDDGTVNEIGMAHSFYIMKSTVASFFVTALKNGVAPNAVMTDVDAYVKDLREIVMDFASGKIKDGEVRKN